MPTSTFGPPPAETFDVAPTATEVEFFVDSGYLVVERITTDAELWLTEIYEHIFSPENADEHGAPVDRTNGRGEKRPVDLRQAFIPERKRGG